MMQENPEMARGAGKENKEAFTKFWQEAKITLNSLGPPIKEIASWKKVLLTTLSKIINNKVFIGLVGS